MSIPWRECPHKLFEQLIGVIGTFLSPVAILVLSQKIFSFARDVQGRSQIEEQSARLGLSKEHCQHRSGEQACAGNQALKGEVDGPEFLQDAVVDFEVSLSSPVDQRGLDRFDWQPSYATAKATGKTSPEEDLYCTCSPISDSSIGSGRSFREGEGGDCGGCAQMERHGMPGSPPQQYKLVTRRILSGQNAHNSQPNRSRSPSEQRKSGEDRSSPLNRHTQSFVDLHPTRTESPAEQKYTTQMRTNSSYNKTCGLQFDRSNRTNCLAGHKPPINVTDETQGHQINGLEFHRSAKRCKNVVSQTRLNEKGTNIHIRQAANREALRSSSNVNSAQQTQLADVHAPSENQKVHSPGDHSVSRIRSSSSYTLSNRNDITELDIPRPPQNTSNSRNQETSPEAAESNKPKEQTVDSEIHHQRIHPGVIFRHQTDTLHAVRDTTAEIKPPEHQRNSKENVKKTCSFGLSRSAVHSKTHTLNQQTENRQTLPAIECTKSSSGDISNTNSFRRINTSSPKASSDLKCSTKIPTKICRDQKTRTEEHTAIVLEKQGASLKTDKDPAKDQVQVGSNRSLQEAEDALQNHKGATPTRQTCLKSDQSRDNGLHHVKSQKDNLDVLKRDALSSEATLQERLSKTTVKQVKPLWSDNMSLPPSRLPRLRSGTEMGRQSPAFRTGKKLEDLDQTVKCKNTSDHLEVSSQEVPDSTSSEVKTSPQELPDHHCVQEVEEQNADDDAGTDVDSCENWQPKENHTEDISEWLSSAFKAMIPSFGHPKERGRKSPKQSYPSPEVDRMEEGEDDVDQSPPRMKQRSPGPRHTVQDADLENQSSATLCHFRRTLQSWKKELLAMHAALDASAAIITHGPCEHCKNESDCRTSRDCYTSFLAQEFCRVILQFKQSHLESNRSPELVHHRDWNLKKAPDQGVDPPYRGQRCLCSCSNPECSRSCGSSVSDDTPCVRVLLDDINLLLERLERLKLSSYGKATEDQTERPSHDRRSANRERLCDHQRCCFQSSELSNALSDDLLTGAERTQARAPCPTPSLSLGDQQDIKTQTSDSLPRDGTAPKQALGKREQGQIRQISPHQVKRCLSHRSPDTCHEICCKGNGPHPFQKREGLSKGQETRENHRQTEERVLSPSPSISFGDELSYLEGMTEATEMENSDGDRSSVKSTERASSPSNFLRSLNEYNSERKANYVLQSPQKKCPHSRPDAECLLFPSLDNCASTDGKCSVSKSEDLAGARNRSLGKFALRYLEHIETRHDILPSSDLTITKTVSSEEPVKLKPKSSSEVNIAVAEIANTSKTCQKQQSTPVLSTEKLAAQQCPEAGGDTHVSCESCMTPQKSPCLPLVRTVENIIDSLGKLKHDTPEGNKELQHDLVVTGGDSLLQQTSKVKYTCCVNNQNQTQNLKRFEKESEEKSHPCQHHLDRKKACADPSGDPNRGTSQHDAALHAASTTTRESSAVNRKTLRQHPAKGNDSDVLGAFQDVLSDLQQICSMKPVPGTETREVPKDSISSSKSSDLKRSASLLLRKSQSVTSVHLRDLSSPVPHVSMLCSSSSCCSLMTSEDDLTAGVPSFRKAFHHLEKTMGELITVMNIHQTYRS